MVTVVQKVYFKIKMHISEHDDQSLRIYVPTFQV